MAGVSGRRGFSWAWLGTGLLVGAALSGALVMLLARAAAALPPGRIYAFLGIGVGLGTWDIVGGCALTFPRRQTYNGATSYAGPWLGLLAWGLDVGLGFTTFRASRLYWIGALMLVAGSPPTVCLIGFFSYALAFLWAVRHGRDLAVPERWLIRRRRLLGLVGITVLAALIAVVTSVR